MALVRELKAAIRPTPAEAWTASFDCGTKPDDMKANRFRRRDLALAWGRSWEVAGVNDTSPVVGRTITFGRAFVNQDSGPPSANALDKLQQSLMLVRSFGPVSGAYWHVAGCG